MPQSRQRNQPPAPEKDGPKGLSNAKLPPLVRVMRSMLDEFPKPNLRGQLAWKKKKEATGSSAQNELLKPENCLTEKQVQQFLKEKVPSYPLLNVPNPAIRAKKLLSLNNGKLDEFPDVVQQAADHFRVVEGQRFLLIAPEYFCRDALMESEEFRMKSDDGSITGVMPRCPWCKSNERVSFKSWECQNVVTAPRCGIHTDASRIPLAGGRYWCKKKGCVGEMPHGEADKFGNIPMIDKKGEIRLHDTGEPMMWYRSNHEDQDHTFVIWSKGCFEQFPPSVQKTFSRFVFGLAHEYEGSEPNLLPTKEIALELLDTSKTFASITSQLQSHYEVQRENSKEAYYTFVKQHGQSFAARLDFFRRRDLPPPPPIVVEWPDFDEESFEKEMGPPKEDAMESVFWFSFQMIKPYLLRDLYSRTPGRFVRWDGTSKAAKKIINIDELDSIETLLLLAGEYGHIVSYAFAHDENPTNLQLLHYFLMKRCERIGPKSVHDVQWGYDDLGSMNYKDPKKHWFATIWPNVKRAPLKDPLHAVMLVGRSTYSHAHPLNDTFARDLTACLMEFEAASVKAAVRQYRKQFPSETKDIARLKVSQDKVWKRKMYNHTLPIWQQRSRVNTLYEKTLKADEEFMAAGHPRFLKLSTATSRSTGCEIQNLISHIDRGDYQDPLPCREMSFELRGAFASNVAAPKKRKEGLEDLGRLRGTNTVESSNKQINYSVQHATRIRKELCEAKILLKIHYHNLLKDRLFGHKIGRTAKDLFWLLQEANYMLASDIDYLKKTDSGVTFPPIRYVSEPLGIEFENYKKYLAAGEVSYLEDIASQKKPTHRPVCSLANPGSAAAAPPTTPVRETPTPPAAAAAETVTRTPAAAATATARHPSPGSPASEFDASWLDDFNPDDIVGDYFNKNPTSPPTRVQVTTNVTPAVQSPISPTIRSPVSASTPPRTKKATSPVAILPKNPLTPKKRKYYSQGNTVYNRKEGMRSKTSPICMSAQLPLSDGQKERAAKILAHIASSGTPSKNQSTSATARQLKFMWDNAEFLQQQQDGLAMGTLPIGVAEKICNNATDMMIKSLMDGDNLTVLHPKDVQNPAYQLPPPPPPIKRKRGRPRQYKEKVHNIDFTPITELTSDMIDAKTFSAEKARLYIIHYNKLYNKKAKIPGSRDPRKESLKQLVEEVKMQLNNAVEIN